MTTVPAATTSRVSSGSAGHSASRPKSARSLFERLVAEGQTVHLLDTQYRMHPAISTHASALFYDGLLQDAPAVSGAGWQRKFHGAGFVPFMFFDLDSSAEVRDDSMSPKNPEEARLVLRLFQAIRAAAKDGGELPRGGGATWAAVITPYTEQLSELKRRFGELESGRYTPEVQLNTVDAFQGAL